jgi:hypothetical protein
MEQPAVKSGQSSATSCRFANPAYPATAQYVVRKTVEFAALVRNLEVEFLPGLIKQRNDPVIEQIEKIPQRRVARTNALIHQFAVGPRQNSLRAVQSHEVHAHQWRLAFAQFQRLDLTGRKRHVRVRGKAHHFGGRVVEPAHYLPFGLDARHQPDRLEKLEQIRLPFEQLRDRPAL